ncbi:hypothetical protein B5X24_HaOG216734 [Helicoverpa armigera]|nr:hypothetical protein B5X24_HaOG216734 [Helicoverpa armigera]
MLVRLCLIVAAIAMLPYYESAHGDVMPEYIKKALREKEGTPPQLRRAKTTTLTNLTIQSVFDKIKDITRNLNIFAMRNGYNVDYKFRMFN